MDWISKHKLLTFLAAVAILTVLFFFPSNSLRARGGQFVRDLSLQRIGNITAWVSTDKNFIEYGDDLTYSVGFFNSGKEEIRNLCIALDAPGFGESQRFQQCNLVIPPQSTVSITNKLRAISRSGQYRILAIYSAKFGESQLRSSLSTGPIEMEGWFGRNSWVRFIRRIASVAKDLTLPFVLVILGYVFQKRQTAQAAQHEDALKKREERQQVRSTILPFVQALSEKHYMPIVRSSVSFAGDCEKWSKETDPITKDIKSMRCFYDFIVLLKRMAYLRDDKGQIFFQNRIAESIASGAWTIARDRFQAILTQEGMDKYLKILPGMDYVKFCNMDSGEFRQQYAGVDKSPEFQRFVTWLATENFVKYLNLIDLIQAVFKFEANRPFDEHWYEDSRIATIEFLSTKNDFPVPDRDFPSNEELGSERLTKQLDALKIRLQGYLKGIKESETRNI